MKIITILGARPQFIKAAAVSRVIKNKSDIIELILHTGQHFDDNMSNVFFNEMKIPKPHYYLDINNLSHGAMTGRMLEGIEKILKKEKPDLVLVYGDTNSTLAGALAASKEHIQVAHIEAGLRSFNMQMPEEVNRILTDRISNYLFCPSKTAINNLNNEGFKDYNCKIIQSGDVMYDAALFYVNLSKKKHSILEDHNLIKNNYALLTLHRAENTNDLNKLKSILEGLQKIQNKIPILFPIHPRTKKVLENNKIDVKYYLNNSTIIDPVGYLDMISLLNNCKLVLTDSGGLQKEAYFFKKPCITLRDETEWTELVKEKFNFLTGSDTFSIINTVEKVLNMDFKFDKVLYGDGTAAEIIVNTLQ